MLLPNDQMLVLGGEGMRLETMEQISKHMERFLRGTGKAATLNGVTMIIDARIVPAIAFEVPK